MDFKVGDIVRVRDDLIAGELYGTLYYAIYSKGRGTFFHENMEKYKGKKYEVIKYTSFNNTYRLRDCGDWDFSEEMLEPVKEPPHKLIKKLLELQEELEAFEHDDNISISNIAASLEYIIKKIKVEEIIIDESMARQGIMTLTFEE